MQAVAMPSLREPQVERGSNYRSIRAAARELGVAEITVRRAVLSGRIPAVQICGRWRIPGSYFTELERTAYGRSTAQSFTRDVPGRVQKKASTGRAAVDWEKSAPPSGRLDIVRPALHHPAASSTQPSGG
jgi:hypothetical protein